MTLGAALLIALVAVLPTLRHVAASPGSVRVGGISIEWWYGGLLAPVAGWLVAVLALKTPRAGVATTGRVRGRAEPDEGATAVPPAAGG